QGAAFVVRHADDVFGMIAEVDALAAGFRMRADDRMIHRRLRPLLFLGHRVLPMTSRAREIEIVDGAQVGDARLPWRVEPLVRAVQVAEVRLAVYLGNDLILIE